jgi:hypothetical protein
MIMDYFERYETRPGLTLNRIKAILWETIKTFGEERLPLWTRDRCGLIYDRAFVIGDNDNMEIKCFRCSGTELDTHVRIAGPSYYDAVGMGVCVYVNCSGIPFIKITEKYIIYRPDRLGRMIGDKDYKYKPGSWLVGDTLKDFVSLIIDTFERKYNIIKNERSFFMFTFDQIMNISKDEFSKLSTENKELVLKILSEYKETGESATLKELRYIFDPSNSMATLRLDRDTELEESSSKKHASELMEQFDILTRKQISDIVTAPHSNTDAFLVGIDTSSVPPETCNFSINLEKLFIDKGDFTMKIKEVTYSGKATIVFWTDGTKTVVKTAEGETFSKDVGLAMAIAEKYFGSYSAMKSYIKRNTKDANEANAKKKQKKEKKED